MAKKKIKKVKLEEGEKLKFSSSVNNNSNFLLEHPLFCFKYMDKSKQFGIIKFSSTEYKALVKTLQKLSQMTWKDINSADRHGCGTEKIDKGSIKGSIPKFFEKEEYFIAFRFNGKAPMVGVKEKNGVFHIIWLDRKFELYNHG